jgi:uncharacterized membrane protein
MAAELPMKRGTMLEIRSRRRVGGVVVAATFTVSVGVAPAEPVAFLGLGDLPGGEFSSTLGGMSRDGRTIVGWSRTQGTTVDRNQAFRWSRDTGMQALPFPPGTRTGESRAVDVTDDSLEILGTAEHPVKWVAGATDPVALPVPSGWGAVPTAISADGQVSVGNGGQMGSLDRRPLRWDPDSLPLVMEGSSEATVWDLAGSGAFAVGFEQVGTREKAVVWDALGRMSFLVDPNPASWSGAGGISTDDQFILGTVHDWGAVVWDLNGGYELLLGAGEFTSTRVNAASDDARLVAGRARRGGLSTAVFWDDNREIIAVDEYLSMRGVDLTGWVLTQVLEVSSDGRVLAGDGFNPDGNREAWVAYIPTPGTALVLAAVPAFAARRRRTA